jgi:deoxyribonuclease V
MIFALDVHYEDTGAWTGCIGFDRWSADETVYETRRFSDGPVAAYVPGQFFLRELPRLLAAIEDAPCRETEAIVIDGHAWLTAERPALGAHLFAALAERAPVVGVAKRSFHDGVAVPLLRGESRQPLFVSAAGMDPARAVECVRSMHGAHRLPTMLQHVDHIARGYRAPNPAKGATT